MYNWPLAKNNFTWLDRLKICGFFLNPKNRWTQDKYVRKFERIAADYVGSKYAVFVSSGSSANQLIAQYQKEKLIQSGEWPRKNKVIVSAVTWQTNVSVWVQLGFTPIFADVNLDDYGMNLSEVRSLCELYKNQIACIFPTSVLGYALNTEEYKKISQEYNIPVYLDCCENSESCVFDSSKDRIINQCALFTSSTSCFVAHQWSNGMEGGFVFTNDQEEYKYFIMARAHGLRRNLLQYGLTEEFLKKSNNLVSPEFDFQVLSSNFRNTEIAAFTGILDSRKWTKHKNHRLDIGRAFRLNKDKYHVSLQHSHVPFCLHIISKTIEQKYKVEGFLRARGIEYRPFISGNMLRQIPYQEYGDFTKYPNAEFLNNHALYIGINYDLTIRQVEELTKDLNNL